MYANFFHQQKTYFGFCENMNRVRMMLGHDIIRRCDSAGVGVVLL